MWYGHGHSWMKWRIFIGQFAMYRYFSIETIGFPYRFLNLLEGDKHIQSSLVRTQLSCFNIPIQSMCYDLVLQVIPPKITKHTSTLL
jgi:hypothetical protein